MIEGKDDADNPKEEDCSAPECIIDKITVKSINWVQCQICSECYHIYCVPRTKTTLKWMTLLVILAAMLYSYKKWYFPLHLMFFNVVYHSMYMLL